MSKNKFIIKINPADLVPKNSARLFYYGAFWVIVVQALAIGILWKSIPKVVPMFFTQPWGEARLAPKMFLILIPLLSILSIAINLIMGRSAKEESPLLPYTLAVSSLMIVVMFSIALSGILQSIL